MKLLLKKDIRNLGLIGDVVEVREGYARNYLIPHGLAVQPTPANVKQIEAARALAAEERRRSQEARQASASKLAGTEVTIKAAANQEGVLYGSVGPREIAAALRDEGHDIEVSQVQLHEPIRHLDNVVVPVVFDEDIVVQVKVWVVREAGSEVYDLGPATEAAAESSTEATSIDSGADTAEHT